MSKKKSARTKEFNGVIMTTDQKIPGWLHRLLVALITLKVACRVSKKKSARTEELKGVISFFSTFPFALDCCMTYVYMFYVFYARKIDVRAMGSIHSHGERPSISAYKYRMKNRIPGSWKNRNL